MESEKLEPSRSGEAYTLCCSTFGPGPFYEDDFGEDCSPGNEIKAILSVICDDADVELEMIEEEDAA